MGDFGRIRTHDFLINGHTLKLLENSLFSQFLVHVYVYLISEGYLDELERVVSCPDRYYNDINHY